MVEEVDSMSSKNISVGRKVLFVGGPEAGNVRIIPESHGETIAADHDWIYRIWPIRIPGSNEIAYFAYAADQHPLKLFIDMWREYSPVAQIKRNNPEVAQTYQTVKRQTAARKQVGK